jgi:hypothetical protein
MNEVEPLNRNGEKDIDPNVTSDLDIETEQVLRPREPGLGERIRTLFGNIGRSGPKPRKELAKDRTHSLALLIGGTVGAVLLFIGVFSTPIRPPAGETNRRPTPNLGRRASASPPSRSRNSVTPLLNADVATDSVNADQLSPADIQATSRAASGEKVPHAPEASLDARVPEAPPPPVRNFDRPASYLNTGPDPLAAYRLNNSTGAPTYSYGGPRAAGGEWSGTNVLRGMVPPFAENRSDSPVGAKSLIVFVRSPEPAQTAPGIRPAVTAPFEQISLVSPGTSLLARLEAAATTALKMPVVASIEYNYERDGRIVVPAGTKVIGDVEQASPQGYLHIRFHMLRMPDGREEAMEATAISLDHQPLKGQVSGKNSGRKVLSRTLSGVGTVAAYAVGGGAGLRRTITGESLLRDRLAGNVALAGEQELTNAAYTENISVTVPANTRFYVVVQKPAVATVPARISEPARPSVEMPTVQELRELMELRREINRMYQESNNSLSREAKP